MIYNLIKIILILNFILFLGLLIFNSTLPGNPPHRGIIKEAGIVTFYLKITVCSPSETREMRRNESDFNATHLQWGCRVANTRRDACSKMS
jgi:hypothetical protein